VWLGVMLPVLGIKSLSPYAVSYLDRLLMMHPNLTKGFGMIGPKDFFPLLDFAFMPNNSLSPRYMDPCRHSRATGRAPVPPGAILVPPVPSRALRPAVPPPQLLTSMSQCLTLDPLSFSVWRQLYTKHLAQSSLLLNHLLESWESSSKKVHQSLQETVRSFTVTNEELAARGDQNVAACDTACKELLCKMKGRGFPWSRLLLVLLLFAAGCFLHDLQTHGSFQASNCARLLRSSGVLPASQLAWQKVSRACLQGFRWLQHSLAQHGAVAVAVLWPQLELLWSTSAEVAQAVSQQCCSLLSWLHGSLPWLSDWLQSRLPEALLHLAECARELLHFVLQSCLLPLLQGLAAALQRGWQHCLDSCDGDVTWECLRGHLTSFTYSSWIYLQKATLALKDWALAMISG
ncbi:T214B protein, partial [Peucedramus taeniatus]|nr:T214B protein [Peucedramus taeniatus]